MIFVEVTDNAGNVTNRINGVSFLKIMERNFKKFGFLADAVAFYNREYSGKQTAIIKLGKKA